MEVSVRQFLGYLGCAWTVLAEALVVLGSLEIAHLVSVSMLLVSMLIVVSVVATELVAMSVRRRA